MKLDVPFFESEKETDCGPLAVKMVLSYFGKNLDKEEIGKLERQLESGMVWSAGIARAAKLLKFKVKYISIGEDPTTGELDFYKKYANDKAMLVAKELIDELPKIGITWEKRNMSFEELLGYIDEDSVPIVLLNWYAIRNKDGYTGHFVPIVGYDEKNVYVHNPGLLNPMAFMPIEKSLFIKAWESKGTDKDAIIISK